MTDYRITVRHRCERVCETTCTDWQHALSVAGTMARGYPRCDISAYDADKFDVDYQEGSPVVFTGLTDEHHEEVAEAVEAASGGG